MEESLAWLRTPAAAPALPGLITSLIKDIRVILIHPGLGNAAKLTEIMRATDTLAPPPPPQAPPVAAGIAGLARALAASTGPATAVFSELAGEPVKVSVWCRATRLLTPSECARPARPARHRRGPPAGHAPHRVRRDRRGSDLPGRHVPPRPGGDHRTRR